MDRDSAKLYVKEHWREILHDWTGPAKDKANGETSYICPLCAHGTGGDGLTYNRTSANPGALKCFSCDFSGDIIELYRQDAQQRGNPDPGFIKAVDDLAAMLNITVDPYTPTQSGANGLLSGFYPLDDKEPTKEQKPLTGAEKPLTGSADFTAYYESAAQHITDPAAVEYLQRRGISLATAQAYKIGFDCMADPVAAPGAIPATGTTVHLDACRRPAPTAEKRHPEPRIIIPDTKSHYSARAILQDVERRYKILNPVNKDDCSPVGIFNLQALHGGAKCVFVCEGPFDALAFLEIGKAAIALHSCSNVTLLCNHLERHPTKAHLILCLDNDAAGAKDTKKAAAMLDRLKVPYTIGTADIMGRMEVKDASDALLKDRRQFETLATDAETAARRPDSVSWYIRHAMGADIAEQGEPTPTGFNTFDKALDGGFRNGALYVLAAIPGLGKTSLALQIADNIAARRDVLYFSLEMSKLDLVSRSISRQTFIDDPAHAVHPNMIQEGRATRAQWATIQSSAARYADTIGDRLAIIESRFASSAFDVAAKAREYRDIDPEAPAPVIIVDYLQIMARDPKSTAHSPREEVGDNIKALKQLALELKAPVLAVCSLNRANYTVPMDLTSLKETGDIEYTADSVFGLQLACVHELEKKKTETAKRAAVDAALKERPRALELAALKNRRGEARFSVALDYWPAYNFMEPHTDDFAKLRARTEKGGSK